MVRHEAVRVKHPTVLIAGRSQQAEEPVAIVFVAIDWLASVATRSDVVECTRNIEAKWTRHDGGRYVARHDHAQS